MTMTDTQLTEAEKVEQWNKEYNVGAEFMWRSSCGTHDIFPVVTTGNARLDANNKAIVRARRLFSSDKEHYIFLDQLEPKK